MGGGVPFCQKVQEVWLSHFLCHWDWSMGLEFLARSIRGQILRQLFIQLSFADTNNHCLYPLIY